MSVFRNRGVDVLSHSSELEASCYIHSSNVYSHHVSEEL
jgi:hypothetical protein